MPGAIKILPHYTYEEYVQWEGKWELIEGIPYAMSPTSTPRHQMIGANLLAEFRFALKKCDHCKVSQPVDYKVAEDTVLQPDVLVICQDVKKGFLDFPPTLVTEILSPSTALKDRHSKYALYEKERIPYYLIVSPDTEVVEIYELNDNHHYELKEQGHTITYTFLFEQECQVAIDFSEIWK